MTTLDDLNHSGLLSLRSESNPDVTLTVGVFQGNASFTVFTKGGPPSFKVQLNSITVSLIKRLLRKLVAGAKPGYRMPLNLRDYDRDARKFNVVGGLAFGIDDTNTMYVEAAGKGLSERFKFPVKIPGSLDYSNADLTEREVLEIAADSIIDVLCFDVSNSKSLSRVKRQPGAGGNKGSWGNKGSSNGNGNYRSANNNHSSGGGGGGDHGTQIEEEGFFA